MKLFKNVKRMLSLLLIVAMMITVAPIQVDAAAGDYELTPISWDNKAGTWMFEGEARDVTFATPLRFVNLGDKSQRSTQSIKFGTVNQNYQSWKQAGEGNPIEVVFDNGLATLTVNGKQAFTDKAYTNPKEVNVIKFALKHTGKTQFQPVDIALKDFTINGKAVDTTDYSFVGTDGAQGLECVVALEESITGAVTITGNIWINGLATTGVRENVKCDFSVGYMELKEPTYIVVYTDGADGEAFDEVSYLDVSEDDIPEFDGELVRAGYAFAEWARRDEVIDGINVIIYTAVWGSDENGNSELDEEDPHYTVTYTDGVEGDVVFVDQVTEDVLVDLATPAFVGATPVREGYEFVGWDKKVADTVTEAVVYAAVWKEVKAPATPDEDTTVTPDQNTDANPETGDNTMSTELLVLMFLSLAGIAVVLTKKSKYSRI